MTQATMPEGSVLQLVVGGMLLPWDPARKRPRRHPRTSPVRMTLAQPADRDRWVRACGVEEARPGRGSGSRSRGARHDPTRRHPRLARIRAAIVLVATLVPAAPVGAQPSSAPAATPARQGAVPADAAGPSSDPDSHGGAAAMRDVLATDRALLVELRKDIPATREEAIEHIARVTSLALASDPAGLGVIVSRVREAAPAWLDWRDGQYPTSQDASDAYARTGAAAFDVSWANLHDAALLTVVNRLDTIIDLADRIEDGG
ncbi:MAG: hypothetical protein R3C32_07245 [Chloroflexota bacterium]